MAGLTCDLCTERIPPYCERTLFKQYRAEGVEHLCAECNADLGKVAFLHDRKMRAIEGRLRRRRVVAYIRMRLGLDTLAGEE